MKEFFMTSAIPYWLLFLITVIPVGYSAFVTFRSDNDARISRNTMLTISGLLLASALSVILFYITLGGNALWWVTGKEIVFWSKLLRVIPLLIFLLLQGAAPFAYKIFMEKYFHCDSLSVKSQFISLVVIVPVAIIISIFFNTPTRNLIFYIIAGVGLIVAAIYSATKNIGSLGAKAGLIYTITSFMLCAATLVTLLYFIVAFISLIVEMLPVIAVIIGICVIFSKSYGNAVMCRDDAGNYIATDGSKYSSESARNAKNTQIHNQRKNS